MMSEQERADLQFLISQAIEQTLTLHNLRAIGLQANNVQTWIPMVPVLMNRVNELETLDRTQQTSRNIVDEIFVKVEELEGKLDKIGDVCLNNNDTELAKAIADILAA